MLNTRRYIAEIFTIPQYSALMIEIGTVDAVMDLIVPELINIDYNKYVEECMDILVTSIIETHHAEDDYLAMGSNTPISWATDKAYRLLPVYNELWNFRWNHIPEQYISKATYVGHMREEHILIIDITF